METNPKDEYETFGECSNYGKDLILIEDSKTGLCEWCRKIEEDRTLGRNY